MRQRLTRTGGLLLGLTVGFASGERASACSCNSELPERVLLEIESVSVDGTPVSDLTPWRRYGVGLAPRADGTLQLRAYGESLPQVEDYAPSR